MLLARASLIFGGKQMNDEKTAKDCACPVRKRCVRWRLTCAAPADNIEGGSVLHLVLALRGGAC